MGIIVEVDKQHSEEDSCETESLPAIKDKEINTSEVSELKLGGYIDSSGTIEAEIIEETPVNPMEHMANMQEEHDNYNSPQSAWERLENIHGKIDIITLRNLFIKALKENEDSVGLGKYLEFHNKIKLTEVSKIILDENGVFKNSDDILIEVEDNPKIGLALENLNSDNPNKNDVKLEHYDFILFSYIGMAKLVEGENIYNWIDKTLYEKDRQPKIGFFKALGGQVRALASGIKNKAIDTTVNTKNKLIALPEAFNQKMSKEEATELLFEAIITKDIKLLKKAIKAGGDVNATDKHDVLTPLVIACGNGMPVIFADTLLKNKADVNKNANGYLPIINAAINGNSEMVKTLIKYNVNLFKRNKSDRTALFWAEHEQQNETAEILRNEMEKQKNDFIAAGIEGSMKDIIPFVKRSPEIINEIDSDGNHIFSYICKKTKNPKVIYHMAENGAEINHQDVHGNTPLIDAAYFGNGEAASILIENKADVTIVSLDGYTALDEAKRRNHLNIARIIGIRLAEIAYLANQELLNAVKENDIERVIKAMKNGADVNYQDSNGDTAFHIACKEATTDIDILQTMIKHGANETITGQDDKTPLDWAEIKQSMKKIKVIKDALNARRNDITNAIDELHNACINGDYNKVKTLINAGFNVNATDKDGNTAILFASIRGHSEIVELLIKNGAKVNVKNNAGITPLMRATVKSKTKTMQILIDNRADLYAKDNEGKSVIYYADNSLYFEKSRPLINKAIQKRKKATADLIKAIKEGIYINVEQAILSGADVNSPSGGFHSLPLNIAVLSRNRSVESNTFEKNYYEISKLLIKNGANVNGEDELRGTPLDIAAGNNDIYMIKLLFDNKADVNYEDRYTKTPFLNACAWSLTLPSVINLMIKNGANINYQNEEGLTALMLITRANPEYNKDTYHNQIEKVKILIANGADLSLTDKYGKTALDYAKENNHLEMIKMIEDEIEKPQKAKNLDLLNAIKNSIYNKVEQAILNGADINGQDDDGNTAFMLAVQVNEHRIIKLLIKNRANLNTPNNNGNPPLIWAIRNGRITASKMIINSEIADLDIQDKDGVTPLFMAVAESNHEVIKMLTNKKANPNIPDNDGDYPLTWAIKNRRSASAKIIIDSDLADLNVQDKDGVTPLFMAVSKSNHEVIKMLTNKKANPNIPDNDGDYPLTWAITTGRMASAKIIIESDLADLNVQDKDGVTPLFRAVAKGAHDVTKMLTNKKANPNIPDNDGDYPLTWALENDYISSAKIIINSGLVDFSVKNSKGETPLDIAIQINNKEIIDLIKNAMDKNNDSKIPAIISAIINKNPAKVRNQLIDGADIYETIPGTDKDAVSMIDEIYSKNRCAATKDIKELIHAEAKRRKHGHSKFNSKEMAILKQIALSGQKTR